MLTVAFHAGLLGIPLALILISWFFKYAYILFDHTVRGFDEPPALDIQMINPADEFRPIAQVLIVGAIYVAVQSTANEIGTGAAMALGALAGALLPASAAVLGLEGNVLSALDPTKLLRLIHGLGRQYLFVCALIAGYAILGSLLSELGLWVPCQWAFVMFAVLSVVGFLAGAMYERRDELGLQVWRAPELTAEKRAREDGRANEAMLTDAYGQVRAGRHALAWRTLEDWLAGSGHRLEDYRWLSRRLEAWNDPRYATRMTEEYVDRLLEAKQTGEALDAVERRLRTDPQFRPKSAASTLVLARLAAHGGGAPGVARRLLADFATRFPGDPSGAAAAALARELDAH